MTYLPKWKIMKIVFGFNFLGLSFMCLILLADVFNIEIPVYHYKIYNETVYIKGYDILPPLTERNVSYYTRAVEENRTYDRMTNIAFLKVHKAGSTTMQNLFFRFGLRHNLNIVLPRNDNYVQSKKSVIPLKPPKLFNIFACHAVYSKLLFDQLIPTGSVKIGIVREPVDRIISAAYYYRDVFGVPYLRKIPQANFIHNLINYPERYDNGGYSNTHNTMGEDFGFDESLKHTDTAKINAYLEDLNSEFVLVMLVERFEESLVMMKRYLNWSFIDIIYLQSNSNPHKPIVLNEKEKATVRRANFLDFAIYKYFTKVFEEKLLSMKPDFNAEVDYFKQILSKVFTFCNQKNLSMDSKLLIGKSHWEDEFTVPSTECKWMKTEELVFIDFLRDELVKSGG